MKNLLILTICITLISACDSKRKNDEPILSLANSLNLALKNTVEESILPSFFAFKTETDILQTKVTTFCNNINQSNLSDLQSQWKNLSLQWNKIAMYNIGPLNDDLFTPKINFIESMRLRGTDYTNTVRGELATRLTDATVLDQSYFDALNFKFVGILALEVLIFEDSVIQSTDLSNIVSDYQASGTGNRKCEYLTGMAQLLGRTATIVENGWQLEFLSTGKAFKDILLNGVLDDGSESVPTLITVIQEHLDYLKKRKLEAILDAQIADYFYENILATLDEIEVILESKNGGKNKASFSFFNQMISAGFGEQVNIVKNNINTARSAATDKNRSELSAAIGFLDGNFKREIPDSLNVELGINFTDGD